MIDFKAFLLLPIFLGVVVAGPAVPVQALAVRQDNKLPNCDDKSQTYNGRYADNSGTYVTSDKITHPYKFPLIRKCWWDYYVVEAAPELTPWQKATGNIYCTNSERCVATKMSGKSVCQERSESVSASVGVAIEGFSLGVDFTVTKSESRCVTADDSTACSWNDGQCHTIWTQQQILRQKGYRRQRCDWGKGDETQCMGDWEQTTPSDLINYGCGSKCTDTNDCGHTDGTPCP
ncbi:hypothetical protein FPSE_11377 [Fusarium pseudograminearum CS3096]|uniref:Uncharacterized protein n=1 Tax=Fusarium pseudograminearum (strain CS3096) TaxID=1028729 RepID=K3V5Y1_FUSPC|nr:hypothetical protein FPSE_11377 [Fusarium pseudograminearum CS3096]EKJ68369.1 hypothetical protein FPSE_11377 [Fusarium pseudograminearum CS3096]KAF0644705.1 hypothetical protein FPSE5266_11377 [Fusarium pseudograminearum]